MRKKKCLKNLTIDGACKWMVHSEEKSFSSGQAYIVESIHKWINIYSGKCLQMDTLIQWKVFTNGYTYTVESVYKWIDLYSGKCLQMDKLIQWKVFTNG